MQGNIDIQHILKQFPLSLKTVIGLWLLLGVIDLVRMVLESLFWLLPACFNLFVSYQLLKLRSIWRKVAVIVMGIFMAGAFVFGVVICLMLLAPALRDIPAFGLLVGEQFVVKQGVAWLFAAAMVVFICWLHNRVLLRADVRGLFEQGSRTESVS